MSHRIRLHSWQLHLLPNMIGITHRVTTHYGLLLIRPNQFTTHVLPVGVFLTEGVMVYGQRQDLVPQHTIVQMKEYLSASHHLPQLGILLRVVAATVMAVSAVSATTATATTATIGLLLLTITTRTTYTSATLAASIRRAATFARTATLSVVSKNQNNLISVVGKPE